METHDREREAATYAEALTSSIEQWGFRESPASTATVLKQYELIRAEVTTSMQVQQQILGFGIATIGLLAGAAFLGSKADFRSAVLMIFLPLVAYLVVTIWFSEVMRMLRAGGFLMTLEKKLDLHADGSLDWEFKVARGRLKYPVWKPYFGVLDPDQLRLLSVTFLFPDTCGRVNRPRLERCFHPPASIRSFCEHSRGHSLVCCSSFD